MDIGSPACTIDAQDDRQVGCGEQWRSPLGPFDQSDAIAFKVFVQASIEKFLRVRQAIKIKVIQV